MRIGWREQYRCSAQEAIFTALYGFRRNILHLARAFVVPRYLAAIDNVRIQRIGRYIAVFLHTYRMPFAERDLTIVPPRGNPYGSAFLLAAVDVVRESIVGDHVIELRGGLIVPGGKGMTAVNGYNRSLIAGDEHDLGMIGIDPDPVVIVASGRAFKSIPRHPTIGRP